MSSIFLKKLYVWTALAAGITAITIAFVLTAKIIDLAGGVQNETDVLRTLLAGVFLLTSVGGALLGSAGALAPFSASDLSSAHATTPPAPSA